MALIGSKSSLLRRLLRAASTARGQHSAALGQFEGEELYDAPMAEPHAGTHAHRTNTFVREVSPGRSFFWPEAADLHDSAMHARKRCSILH